jgi:DNA-binding NarL/FixJ family response regulator
LLQVFQSVAERLNEKIIEPSIDCVGRDKIDMSECFSESRIKKLYLLNMVRIILVDNHALSRIGLRTVLSNDPRLEIAGDYMSFNTVRSLLPSLLVDLIIVDTTVNEECGYDVVQYLKQWNAGIKVVILTFSKDEMQIVNALQENVEGYISKSADPDEILLGVSKVISGQKYFSPDISHIIVSNAYRRQSRGVPFLTTKEKEIIRLLMDGYSSKQIAARLDVSPRTIHSHRANILSKFNLNNTTQLVSRIVEQKIVL